MTRSAIFWTLMLLWVVLALWFGWPAGGDARSFAPLGSQLLQFVLFALLGWQSYGPAVKG